MAGSTTGGPTTIEGLIVEIANNDCVVNWPNSAGHDIRKEGSYLIFILELPYSSIGILILATPSTPTLQASPYSPLDITVP